jgi:hypothetical protein
VQGPIDITRERGFTYQANFGMVASPALPATTRLGSAPPYAPNELDASLLIDVIGAGGPVDAP